MRIKSPLGDRKRKFIGIKRFDRAESIDRKKKEEIVHVNV